jgi:hypothetical protein
VRLFPVQAVESLAVFGLVAIGTAMVLRGDPPGGAAAWYVIAYAVMRFSLEFIRGDNGRPYAGGFSEAQWTSLLVAAAAAAAAAGRLGWLPHRPWHDAAAAALALAAAAVAMARAARPRDAHGLLSAAHLRELSDAVRRVTAKPHTARADVPPAAPAMSLEITSLGVQISAGEVSAGDACEPRGLHALPSRPSPDARRRRAACRLILRLCCASEQRPPGRWEIVTGRDGVFHQLVHPTDPRPSARLAPGHSEVAIAPLQGTDRPPIIHLPGGKTERV